MISVAQTQVPGAKRFPLVINSPAAIAGQYPNNERVGWAPVVKGFTGEVVYVGRGCEGDAYLANPAGKIALIDRGTCTVSLEVDRAAALTQSNRTLPRRARRFPPKWARATKHS